MNKYILAFSYDGDVPNVKAIQFVYDYLPFHFHLLTTLSHHHTPFCPFGRLLLLLLYIVARKQSISV